MSNDYNDIYEAISRSLLGISKVDNDEEMNKVYLDPYTTREGKKRDKTITKLLELYVESYETKVKGNKWYKLGIVLVCFVGMMVPLVVFYRITSSINFNNPNLKVGNIVELLTVCVSVISLVIGVLKYVVKYVFPENDEQYITRIVELIQQNDLANKQENIKVNDIDDQIQENI